MYSYAKRTDRNHAAIRDELRAALGRDNVRDTSALGSGFPDLIVRSGQALLFVEIKMAGGKQTPAEVEMQNLLGDLYILAYSTEDVLKALGLT